jgi:hypothetical protein
VCDPTGIAREDLVFGEYNEKRDQYTLSDLLGESRCLGQSCGIELSQIASGEQVKDKLGFPAKASSAISSLGFKSLGKTSGLLFRVTNGVDGTYSHAPVYYCQDMCEQMFTVAQHRGHVRIGTKKPYGFVQYEDLDPEILWGDGQPPSWKNPPENTTLRVRQPGPTTSNQLDVAILWEAGQSSPSLQWKSEKAVWPPFDDL